MNPTKVINKIEIIPANKKLDLGKLGEFLGGKIKFASEKDLKEILGLSVGAVSPFGLINDKQSHIQLLIDKEVWESCFVSFHPNINTETLELAKVDFHKYAHSLRNKLRIMEF